MCRALKAHTHAHTHAHARTHTSTHDTANREAARVNARALFGCEDILPMKVVTISDLKKHTKTVYVNVIGIVSTEIPKEVRKNLFD